MKNKNFVAYIPDLDCDWTFNLAMNTSTTHQNIEEMVGIFDYILQACEEFLKPTQVEYVLNKYNEDISVDKLMAVEPTEVHTEEIVSDEGISREDAISCINNDPSLREETWSIHRISIKTGKTLFRLIDGDTYVDNTTQSSYRHMVHDDVIEKTPPSDPLTVEFYRYKSLSSEAPTYTITVSSSTDIWFEDTEIGAINRKRLGRFLTALQNHPNAVDAYFLSSHYGADSLRSKGYDDLIPDL